MKFRKLGILSLLGLGFGVGLGTGCGDTPASEANSEATCAVALQHLETCVSQHCETNEEPVCAILSANTGNSLFGKKSASCDGMGDGDISRLCEAECEDIINDARLLAMGKADFPCPSYFPWCGELAPENAFYHVNVLSSDASGATLEVLVGDVVRKSIVREGAAYNTLSLEGSGQISEPGRPAVPTISFLVGLPAATDTVVVESLEKDDKWEVENIKVAPHVESETEEATPAPFFVDEAFYQKDIAYPDVDYVLDEVSTWRNFRVVRVTVHPFQYNPAQSHLSASRRLTVKLSFLDQQAESDDTVRTGEAANAGAYGSTLVNYPETRDSAAIQDDPQRIRYLVIAHDPLVEAIQPLVDLKQAQGLPTQVVKLSEIGADPIKIKERIAQAYADSSIEYVLLVGDVDDLPMHLYELPWTSFYKDDIPGDYEYSLLAGDDKLPEVSIGRIPGKTPEEVAVQVSKTLAYETGDSMASWRKKALLVAHGENYPSKYTACTENVRTREYKAGNIDFTKIYGGDHGTADDIVRQVDHGVGVIGYRGHGSETAWLDWNGSDFAAGQAHLANGAMTPVVFSIACLNVAMQDEAPSHGEQWVLQPDGGAVGFLGATMRSWTSPNDVFMQHIYRGMLDDGVTAVVPLINRARVEMITQYQPDDSGPDNAMMYIWLGDPSLRVGEAFLAKPQVTVGWCSTVWPEEIALEAGAESDPVFGQVWASGVTEAIGQGADVQGALGFGPAGTDPTDDAWTWEPAEFSTDNGRNDTYMASLTPSEPGTYSYVMRFKGAHDTDWTYCDMDGSQNEFDPSLVGVLTVQ